MKHALVALFSATLVVSCATPTREQSLVDRAVNAMGGAERLAAIKTHLGQGQRQALGARAVRRARRRAALRGRVELRGLHAGRRAPRQPHRLGEELRLPRAAHFHLQRDRHARGRLRARRRQQRPQRAEHEDDARPRTRCRAIASPPRSARRAAAGDWRAHARDAGAARTRCSPRPTSAAIPAVSFDGFIVAFDPAHRAAVARAHARLRQHLGRRDLRHGAVRLARLRWREDRDEPQVPS